MPDLAQEVRALSSNARDIRTHDQVTEFPRLLRQFLIKIEFRADDQAKIHEGLRLLVENIGEMVEDKAMYQAKTIGKNRVVVAE